MRSTSHYPEMCVDAIYVTLSGDVCCCVLRHTIRICVLMHATSHYTEMCVDALYVTLSGDVC